MKKVFIGVGHGGSDPGAVGILVEKKINLTMALACRDLLEAYGLEVLMSRTSDETDPLTDEIKECNAFKSDLAIDMHNNAGNGDGFEAFYSCKCGTSKTLALNIESEITKLGQNSRGCKTRINTSGRDYYGFIRETICPAVIVEGVFVDNKNDVEIADKEEKQKESGRAYARGILRTLGIDLNENKAPEASQNQAIYRVQIGAFKEKSNADACLQRAKDAGFNYVFIVKT